jgi:large subunit ribosomal protein L10
MVATWKKDVVSGLSKQVKSHKVVGVVDISNIPSKHLQDIRKKLKGTADFLIARNNLLMRALDKGGVKGMDGYLKGPSGLIFSNLNPFQLEKLIYGCKTNAPAKPGSVAPFDLIVLAGDTGLPAGPVIGDFQAAGVKAKIQGGRIVVTENSLLVKGGERVDAKVAAVLTRLGIEPREITLKLNAAHEDGVIYAGDVLHIDERETIAKLQGAYRKAVNLAYNAGYYNKETVELFLYNAICKARNLMINAKIINRETISIYLGRADAQANALKAALPLELQAEVEKKE